MKKLIFLLIILSGCSVFTPLQKSNLIAVFHLIENSNYEDAKIVIEEMTNDKEMSKWARTWYARGVLAQTAYVEGKQKNDKKKYELYPDQLQVAFDSFEKARSLDPGERMARQLAPKYVLLANDFKKQGEKFFKKEQYAEALHAFEQALQITRSPILAVQTDKNLIYNTAIAAYESENWPKAIEHLNTLDEYSFSTNVSHLLYTIHLEQKDTLSAEDVLIAGIEKYDHHEDLVVLFADMLYNRNDIEQAAAVLDSAEAKNPSQYIFPYTKGLIFQKEEQYHRAIAAYQKAIDLAPDELMSYVNIATCYFNMGVEIEESARTLNDNRRVMEEKSKSTAAFESAVKWLDKAYDKNPENQRVIVKMYQLYKIMSINDKANELSRKISFYSTN